MNPSVIAKLSMLETRYLEIADQLAQPDATKELTKYRDLCREHSHLEGIVECFKQSQALETALEQATEIVIGNDAELKAIAQEEVKMLKGQLQENETQLKALMIPEDPHDHSDVFVEIRAGTGGDEAAIFVGDLFKMYYRYAEENQSWKTDVIATKESESGGFKEVIMKVSGEDVWSHLKFESGVHRVQRVPETESQGRIHTSAATVAVLPEAEAIDSVEIDTSDLRIDTFRASGAGGQHVNKTDSAIRITHIPSGLAVECQDDRSQHRNKSKAIALLTARLLDMERRKQEQELSQNRKNLIGSGDRSERIRTYNYPQGRITDHRINLTLYQLTQVLEGKLEMLITPLRDEHNADLLAAVEEVD